MQMGFPMHGPQQPMQQHTPPHHLATSFPAQQPMYQTMPGQVNADFQVNQWTPPESHKSSPPRPQESQPKVYQFQNQGPRDFSSEA